MGKSMFIKYKNEGGQNPIEAAKLDCKIYHGPYVSNFEDIYKILSNNKISKQISSYDELSKNLIHDFKNPGNINFKSKNIVDNLGEETLIETMKIINNFLNYEFK